MLELETLIEQLNQIEVTEKRNNNVTYKIFNVSQIDNDLIQELIKEGVITECLTYQSDPIRDVVGVFTNVGADIRELAYNDVFFEDYSPNIAKEKYKEYQSALKTIAMSIEEYLFRKKIEKYCFNSSHERVKS